MTTQLKKTSFSAENTKDVSGTLKPKGERPNIDHLIKRIIVERRKEQKKFLLIGVFVLLIICALVTLSF